MSAVGPLPTGKACAIQMADAPTTPPFTPAWLAFPCCPLLSPPRKPWLHSHCSRESNWKTGRERTEQERERRWLRLGLQEFWVNDVGRGGPRPFCPLSQLFWLVIFLPLPLLPFFVCPSLSLRRTATAQPPTEMTCVVPV